MYRTLCDLLDHRDAVAVRLVSGKVTFVHRRLWPALVAIGTAREPWQTRGLSRGARRLLALLDASRTGVVRVDRLPPPMRLAGKAAGDAAREVETALLAYGDQVHTEQGSHAKRLTTWARWTRGRVRAKRPDVPAAKAAFEEIVDDWDRRFEALAALPWRPRPRGRRRIRLGVAGLS
jgi:hypothetical protein